MTSHCWKSAQQKIPDQPRPAQKARVCFRSSGRTVQPLGPGVPPGRRLCSTKWLSWREPPRPLAVPGWPMLSGPSSSGEISWPKQIGMLFIGITQPRLNSLFRYVEHVPFEFNRTFRGDWSKVLDRELYDLGSPESGSVNLAGKPEFRKTVEKLRRVLRGGWRLAKSNGTAAAAAAWTDFRSCRKCLDQTDHFTDL